MTSELIRHTDLSQRPEELVALLARRAKMYAMGDSSSLPVETVEELLRSIRFTLEMGLESGADSSNLGKLLTAGQQAITREVAQARELYAAVLRTDPGHGSLACKDTQQSIGGFFAAYDIRYFAHSIPCSIDYPLGRLCPEGEGVRYIRGYLTQLLLEHRFCSCFGHSEATLMLERWLPDYRVLVQNLFTPVFTCALGLVLLGKRPHSLELTKADCHRLYEKLHPWHRKNTPRLLHRGTVNLCMELRLWDTATRQLLLEAAKDLIPMLRSTSREGFCQLFACL